MNILKGMCINTNYSMSIINHRLERVFKYEETELSVIKCKNDIWFRGKTIAGNFRLLEPLKAIRKHVDSEDKSEISGLEPKFDQRLGGAQNGHPFKDSYRQRGAIYVTNPVCTASYFVPS